MAAALRVGVLGYGYASKTFHVPLIRATVGLELCAVSTSDAAKLHADWPQLEAVAEHAALLARADIDVVVIPTPNQTHFALAQAALRSGKHVVVDKPFVLDTAQGQALQDEARRAGRVLSVFHNRRWDSDFLSLRQVLQSGELGRVVLVESRMDRFRPEVRVRWRESADPGAGLWYDLGPHLLDQALVLWGVPQSIALHTARQRDGALSDDWFHAVLEYGGPQGGLHVVLQAGMLSAAPQARWVVHGTQGAWVKHGADPQEDALKRGEQPGAAHWGVDASPGTLLGPAGAVNAPHGAPQALGSYETYYAALRDAVWGHGPNPVDAAQATQVIALIELGLQSARSGTRVPVFALAQTGA